MSEKFKNKYRIASARLKDWDYGNNGAYFITICTKDRKHFFGEIVNNEETRQYPIDDKGACVSETRHCLVSTEDNNIGVSETRHCLVSTEAGKLAEKYWLEIPIHFSFIKLGCFVVMPNHFHGILIIDKVEETKDRKNIEENISKKRFQNQGKDTISSIVGSFKSIVTKKARLINKEFGWQERFHDHIIRNSEVFDKIQNYIETNSATWQEDEFYS